MKYLQSIVLVVVPIWGALTEANFPSQQFGVLEKIILAK